MCYLLGDLNIDLFKYDYHKTTSNFLDTMYSYNMFPLIVKPTRVTEKSATLIDHIGQTIFMCHRNIEKFISKIQAVDWQKNHDWNQRSTSM